MNSNFSITIEYEGVEHELLMPNEFDKHEAMRHACEKFERESAANWRRMKVTGCKEVFS